MGENWGWPWRKWHVHLQRRRSIEGPVPPRITGRHTSAGLGGPGGQRTEWRPL